MGVSIIKEYCIYIKKGNCSPYILSSYNDIYSAKDSLYNILKLYDERKKLYFVDNDFFNNKYPEVSASDYYCIKERNVSDWIIYSELNSNNKNKILNFNKAIDILY